MGILRRILHILEKKDDIFVQISKSERAKTGIHMIGDRIKSAKEVMNGEGRQARYKRTKPAGINGSEARPRKTGLDTDAVVESTGRCDTCDGTRCGKVFERRLGKG
jgi:hypothetical protein